MSVVIRAEASAPDQLLRLAVMVIDPESDQPPLRRETEAAASVSDEVTVPTNQLLQLAVCDVTTPSN